jgi:hypothetical protein
MARNERSKRKIRRNSKEFGGGQMNAKNVKATIETLNEFPYYANIQYLSNNYSEDARKDLLFLIENEDKLSESEWKNMFEKHKDIPWSPVLQFMVQSHNVPDKMVDDIAMHLIKGENCGRLHDIIERDRTLHLATARHIDKKTMSAICYFLENRTEGFSNFLFVKKPDIDEENIEAMAVIWLAKRASSKKKTMPILLQYALQEVKNEEFVKTVLKAYPNDEGIRGLLLQNPNINNKLKQEIYEMGIDPLSIVNMNKLPKNIFADMFESIVAAYDSETINPANYEKVKHTVSKTDYQAYSSAKNKLYQMITKGDLPPDREYELFQVMLSQELRSANEITDAILRHTKNDKIFEEMHLCKSKASYGEGLTNIYAPQKSIDRYLTSLAKKIETNYNKKKLYAISGADATIVKELIKNDVALPLPVYSALMVTECSKYNIMQGIILTSQVPKEVLDKIYHNNRSALQSAHKQEAMLAKIRLDLYDNLSNDEQKILCDFLKIATHDDYSHMEESQRSKSQKKYFYSRNKLNDEMSKIMQKVISVTENLSEDDKKHCSQEIKKIKLFAENVQKTCENLKEWNLRECDQLYLENLKYKTSYNFSVHCHESLSFYQSIERFCNEFKEINEAIDHKKEKAEINLEER